MAEFVVLESPRSRVIDFASHRPARATGYDSRHDLRFARDDRVASRKVNALLVTLFGGLALVIVGLGIAGVVALSVSLRTGEIGIRMSLGADGSRVQRMVLGEGWVWVGGGLLLGIACRVRETVYRRLLGHR